MRKSQSCLPNFRQRYGQSESKASLASGSDHSTIEDFGGKSEANSSQQLSAARSPESAASQSNSSLATERKAATSAATLTASSQVSKPRVSKKQSLTQHAKYSDSQQDHLCQANTRQILLNESLLNSKQQPTRHEHTPCDASTSDTSCKVCASNATWQKKVESVCLAVSQYSTPLSDSPTCMLTPESERTRVTANSKHSTAATVITLKSAGMQSDDSSHSLHQHSRSQQFDHSRTRKQKHTHAQRSAFVFTLSNQHHSP